MKYLCSWLQLAKFHRACDGFFDVTAEDAIEIIMADAAKTFEAREEDAEFVWRLRKNEYVAFGARDCDQQGRFNRALGRQEKENKRVERERKQKLVCLQ